MCTPDLQLKVKQAATIFAEDTEEEKKKKNPRDKLKVMTFITGNNAAQQESNDARYVLQSDSP